MKEYAPFHYSFLEKAQRPVRIDEQQFWTKKACPWIQTQTARTECHCSTTCATTTATQGTTLRNLSLEFRPSKAWGHKSCPTWAKNFEANFFSWLEEMKFSQRSTRMTDDHVTNAFRVDCGQAGGGFSRTPNFFLPNGCIRLMTEIATVRFLGTVRSCRELLELNGAVRSC